MMVTRFSIIPSVLSQVGPRRELPLSGRPRIVNMMERTGNCLPKNLKRVDVLVEAGMVGPLEYPPNNIFTVEGTERAFAGAMLFPRQQTCHLELDCLGLRGLDSVKCLEKATGVTVTGLSRQHCVGIAAQGRQSLGIHAG